ncbi:replication restart helicase PriA [Altibacter sp. HG106]|uniref:replication restart helicase PriA n=1 Tax=Altibacter sp. HG106 TaxID=3023937 RepID=UPI002350370B|nr:primosomal protein N' [Altibacter sp. HG106]MDC7993732.1 primosomal protein N' [Altibacter sp. HG106]
MNSIIETSLFFVDVILPIPLRQAFTYAINKDEAAYLKRGMRVSVPFGKSKIYTALVDRVHQQIPDSYEPKEIDQILDEAPLVTAKQWNHWEWMASYYLCTFGEVIRAALPSAFLLESETIIHLSASFDATSIDALPITDEGFLVLEALQHQSSLHINDVRSILDRKRVLSVLQELLQQGYIEVKETLYDAYTPKQKRYIRMASAYASEEKLRALLDSLSRAPKQRSVIMTLFTLRTADKNVGSVQLQKKSNASAAILRTLIDKGVLEEYFLKHDRVSYDGDDPGHLKQLSPAQEQAYSEIVQSFEQKPICLLHGVTSSGKTEIYVKLIEEVLKTGKQVLYMLPEIALTTQLIGRLQAYFGSKVAVYHSKYSVNERVEVWKHVLENSKKAQVVIGARSSLFLPFSSLGLILVDEEHEPSFKQYNPAPRYHGRDAAMLLAHIHGANTLLGSATPSLESFYNAQQEKYGLVSLTERYGKILLPEMELVDLQDAYRKKKMTGHFSERLLVAMRETLAAGDQIILFQNRRGYSPVVSCTTCGTSPQCPNCDVSLTYHQHKNQLRCHYCGYHIAMLHSCMACGMETLDTKGFGTEQIETELQTLFPKHRVARMDQDTTRGKNAYRKLIDQLEEGEIDILVGTQMVAKGLDFRNVRLVGVMQADNLLNFPDFRAHERSFQLLLQVAGRAGRTQKRGKVLIQTYNPHHQILQQVTVNDYQGMYSEETEERYQYKYPPFFRTVKITVKARNFVTMQQAGHWLAQALSLQLKEHVLGPEQPPVGRIRNEYLTCLLIKIPKQQSLPKTKAFILQVYRRFSALKEFSSVKVVIDVDPA